MMDNTQPKISPRKLLLVFVVMVLVFAGYKIGLAISRRGMTPVTIYVAPSDSQVYIDGDESKSGVVYMTPGKYDFSAAREDFKEDKKTKSVGDKPVNVYLLPTPSNAAGAAYIRNNIEVQAEQASVYDKMASEQHDNLSKNSPLLNKLPYTDIENYFSIDYGASETRKDNIELVVSNSTSEGRLNALKWIRQQGYDPTDFEVKFVDFDNPLAGGS